MSTRKAARRHLEHAPFFLSMWKSTFGIAGMLLSTLVAACSSTSLTTSNDAADASADAASIECDVSWRQLDTARGCLLGYAVAKGLCESPAVSTCKRAATTCAVSPTHEFFWSAFNCNSHPHGDGWTFTGQDAMDYGLAPASDADQRLCVYQPPDCPTDGGTDQ